MIENTDVNTETNDSPDSSTEKNDTNASAGDNAEKKGERGFADDPRWKERENDWKERYNDQENRHQGEIEKLRTEFEEKYTPKESKSSRVPAWFGGDDEAWESYQSHQKLERESIRQEIRKEFEGKSEQEKKAIEDATNYMNDKITEIESDKTLNPNGSKVDKNKLLKYTLDNELVDTKGNWNYKAAFRMMKAENKTPFAKDMTDRQNLADATFDRGASDNPNLAKPKTSDDFKKGERPW